jgi:DNA-binding Lrp family transcriptional regulator
MQSEEPAEMVWQPIIDVNQLNDPSLDDLDKRIIEQLHVNGALSNVDLAHRLGSSEATIRRRVASLYEKGYIRRFSALMDFRKLGLNVKMNLFLKVESGKVRRVAEKFAMLPNVCSVHRTIGSYDVAISLYFHDMRGAQAFLDEVPKDEDVMDFKHLIVTETHKPCPFTNL